MARKALRNLALLGGLGAAAAMAMRGKGKDEESKDTTGDASAGMAKDRLSDFRGKSGDADQDIGPAAKPATPAAKPATPAAKPATPAPARSPRMVDTGDETERLARRFPSPVSKTNLSDRSVAKAEGSFSDRQAYKRATQAMQADEKRKAMGMKKGGKVSSASSRADGIAMRGKTKGRMV